MAPPIKKRIISPEVMRASQEGGAPSVQQKQSARKAIIDSTASNYDGTQVARGVPGSVVPANSNAIKAIFRPEAPSDDPIIERPVGPVVINPNGPIGEPGRLVDGYATSALSETPNYMSGGQNTVPFKPEYESSRVPGEPLTATDRFVDRVDMAPDKTQLYTGSPKYTDEAPGAMEAAQRALFRAMTDSDSYTKVPGRLTPEQMDAVSSSFVDDGIDPRAFQVTSGGINTYQKPRGSITLDAIAPYKGRPFELNGDGTYQPGTPATPGRDERVMQLPGRDYDGKRLYGDKKQNVIANLPEGQQAQARRDYPDAMEAYFGPAPEGNYNVGDSDFVVAGSSSSYGYPQAEPSPGALGDSLRANAGARVSFVPEDGSTPQQLFPGSGTQIVSSPGQKTRDEMIASSGGRTVFVRDPNTLKIDVADMAAGAAARLGQFGSQKTRDILNDQDNKLGYNYPNPTFRDIEPDSTVLPKGSYAVNVDAVGAKGGGNVRSSIPEDFTNLGASLEGGDTASSLLGLANENPINGANIGPGLKSDSGAVDYSPEDAVKMVKEAQSIQDFLNLSYDFGGGNKPLRMLATDSGRDGNSNATATRNAEAMAKTSSRYFEMPNYRTVDPKSGGYDMTKPSGIEPPEPTLILDPNSSQATFGSVATRGAYNQMGREAAAKSKESYYEPAGTRNEDSPGWGLPVNQNEDLVPYSDGSLGRARRANGANVAAEVDGIKQDPIVGETMAWVEKNYPDVYANAQGATAFSSMGVDPTTNQLPSGGYGEAELSGKKVSPSLEKYLGRGSTVEADGISLSKTPTYADAIDLPGRDVGDTAQNRVPLGSTVQMAASQSDTGEAGFADNTGDPRAFNRSQTMINPMTGEKKSFRMTDTTGETPGEYLATLERQAKQQQMALQQKTTEFHRDGGIVKDEYGRVLPPNHYVKGFDGKTLYETAIDQDYELGLPARETVYDVAKEIHRAVSPQNRGSGSRDPIFDQFSEDLLLQGNATKDMNLRVQETRNRINALNTETAVDNINESTALSFVGPDGQVRTSLQQMPPDDQLRIQRALKAAGAKEMQNQYSGQVGNGEIAFLQGPRPQDPIEASTMLNRQLNKGEITREQYEQGVAANVQQYEQMRAMDPYVRQQGLARENSVRAEEPLPSREQMAYGSPGIMPESMTTSPNPMSDVRPRRVLNDGVVSEISRTPMEGMMRQAPGQQYPGSRDVVNSVVQVDPARELSRGVMGQRPRVASRTLTSNEDIPQSDLAAADMAAQQIYMSSERRRQLEALGRQGQRG